MRLDGSLEDFGLPDVLQLLACTHKTGALHLAAADEAAHGPHPPRAKARVNAASSDLAARRWPAGSSAPAWSATTRWPRCGRRARRGAELACARLLDAGGRRGRGRHPLAADQATDAVCELLRWPAGKFSFLVGEDDPDGLISGLAGRGPGRRGSAPAWRSGRTLTSLIPSPETVLRLAPSPAIDPTCTREEWGLLALVDGSRSVSEIVALLGRSEFAVAGALAALVERGLLTVDSARIRARRPAAPPGHASPVWNWAAVPHVEEPAPQLEAPPAERPNPRSLTLRSQWMQTPDAGPSAEVPRPAMRRTPTAPVIERPKARWSTPRSPPSRRRPRR